jgi:cytochrome c oxidase subunit III
LSETVISPDSREEALHEGHHPDLQHHFDDMEQQKEASSLGMWVFLAQEIMFFGGLFLLYLIYRMNYYPTFSMASSSIDVKWGAINTLVLIGSSLTMAMAVHSAHLSKRKALVGFLLATLALGGVFLGIKGKEYHDKYVEHHVPGMDNFLFVPEADSSGKIPNGVTQEQAESLKNNPAFQHTALIFFTLYFLMTGTHALHMIVGIGIIIPLIVLASKGRYNSSYYTPIENFGLYWHFVDIIWISLFPLIYLINRTPHIG